MEKRFGNFQESFVRIPKALPQYCLFDSILSILSLDFNEFHEIISWTRPTKSGRSKDCFLKKWSAISVTRELLNWVIMKVSCFDCNAYGVKKFLIIKTVFTHNFFRWTIESIATHIAALTVC